MQKGPIKIMLLDKSLKTFIEKYDQDVFKYITEYSNRLCSALNSFDTINLEESFKRFTEYMDEMSVYYSTPSDTPKHDVTKVLKNTSKFISECAIVEGSYLNRDIPIYFSTFFECIDQLIVCRNEQHARLLESGQTALAGNIVEFYNEFAEKFVEAVEKSTERFKVVSGYNTDKRLSVGFKKIQDDFIL